MRQKRLTCKSCKKRRVCNTKKLCSDCVGNKVTPNEANFMSRDHGKASSGIETYEPILNFNPNDAPANYIIVKMNHNLLDEMLRRMTSRQGAIAIGVPCKRVR